MSQRMQAFRSAARLGARLGQATLSVADELAIAALAEETLRRVLNTSEETLRTVLRNSIARPRHPDWFRDLHVEYLDRYGKPLTQADDWQRSLALAVSDYLERHQGLKPYWANRRRSLTVLEGGRTPAARRRRRSTRLRLVHGGAQ